MSILNYIRRAIGLEKNLQADKKAEMLEKILAEKAIKTKQNISDTRVFRTVSSIKRWKDAIDSALMSPYYSKTELIEICSRAMMDLHLRAQIRTRKNGTLAEPFVLLRNGKLAEKETKKLQTVWFAQVREQILLAKMYWAAGIELRAQNGKIHAYRVHPRYLCPERSMLMPSTLYTEGIPFELFPNMLVFRNPAQGEEALGSIAACAQWTIRKSFSVQDWSRHSEIFGMPFLYMKTDVTDDTEIAKRNKALSEFGQNAYIIINADEELAALDPKTPGTPHLIYESMQLLADKEMSKEIVGQTGTAEEKAFVGSAEVHERILDWYIEADMTDERNEMNEQVLPFLARLGVIPAGLEYDLKYFYDKRNKPAPAPAPVPPPAQEMSYESFLAELQAKKKSLVAAEIVLSNSEEEEESKLFTQWLNGLQRPINDLLNDTQYPQLQTQFTENIYQFSAAKALTYTAQAKGLSEEDKAALLAKMNRYGETEQVQVALSIQAAEEWQELVADANFFPNIEYRTVGDENTRETHQRLNGIVRPLDDDFWERFYPPIDYRCRCSIRQRTVNTPITQALPLELPKVAPGLGHNPGKSGQAFNIRHPYFENINSKQLEGASKYSQYADNSYQKSLFSPRTGGFLAISKQADTGNMRYVQNSAKTLARNGYGVEIPAADSNTSLLIDEKPSALVVVHKDVPDAQVGTRAIERTTALNLTESVLVLQKEQYDATALAKGITEAFAAQPAVEQLIIQRKDKATTARRTDKRLAQRLRSLLK